MPEQSVDTVSHDLIRTQQRISAALAGVAADQDWRPAAGAWSFRYIAAHLAVTEEECFAARLNRLIEEDNPQFEYYDHAGRDFDGHDLLEALATWKRQREIILGAVSRLSEHDLQRAGRHAVYGEMKVIDLLQLMRDHDQEHEAELQILIEQHHAAQAGKTAQSEGPNERTA